MSTGTGLVHDVHGRPAFDFDHYDPAYRARWRLIADEFHAGGRAMAWSEKHDGFWVVGTWEAVRLIGDDWETFTSVNDLDGTENGGRGQVIPRSTYRFYLGESDPPVHTGRRRLEAPFFAPKSLHKWQPATRRFLDEAIDAVVARGHADLIDDIIVPTAARTTLNLLGYDPDKWRDAAAAARRSIYLRPGEDGYPAEELQRMRADFRQTLLARKQNPTGDLISNLALGQVQGAPLGLDEGESMMNALVFGGFDTTASLVANALMHLSANPELGDRFRDNPDLRRNAVEELLRYFPPATGIARTAIRDTEVLGQPIARGERVFLWLAAANRDPQVFPDPGRLDFDRANARDHVSFSVGPHRCLGSPLAKIEILEMLDVIPQRLQNLRIDTDGVKPYPRGITGSFIHVPATFTPGEPLAANAATGQDS